jgi:tRNA threonylcarbamoyladenosine biosynthesis protein TsaE
MNVFLADEAATIGLGERLLRQLPEDLAGWTLLLSGELGAGKSTFARAVICAAGHGGPVPSPTYTLVEPYILPRATIYHIDLYRISCEEELRYLGWHECDDGFRLVEWPDRVPGLRSQADLELTLAYQGDGRRATLTGLSRRGRALVDALENS